MAAPSVSLLKRLAARLPLRWQAELKRLYFRRQIANESLGYNVLRPPGSSNIVCGLKPAPVPQPQQIFEGAR